MLTVFAQFLHSYELEPTWNAYPHHIETQKLGDEFIRSSSALALKVPSAVVQGDFNYLINPLHGDIGDVVLAEVEDFLVDGRLV